jgi:hypothetical protein
VDTIRLAELTGAIARAADAGIGFPPETLRSCLVAVALARGKVVRCRVGEDTALTKAAFAKAGHA